MLFEREMSLHKKESFKFIKRMGWMAQYEARKRWKESEWNEAKKMEWNKSQHIATSASGYAPHHTDGCEN